MGEWDDMMGYEKPEPVAAAVAGTDSEQRLRDAAEDTTGDNALLMKPPQRR